MEWHYARGGTAHGPIDQGEFDKLVANGIIRPDTLVWNEGMQDWVALETLGVEPTIKPEPPIVQRAPEAAKSHENALIDAVKDGAARYVDFRTRSNRSQFWYWMFAMLIFHIAIVLLSGMFGMRFFGGLGQIASFFLILPTIAVAARRLHDVGWRGWWVLLYFVPLVGWIILLVLLVAESEKKTNAWGALPT